ncbi:TPA: helix-turn-helix transcriptional regulator, partial [Legionella pneumophila]|nr:helix-turn-helix transcriptional regulator [Legionella pneumophila]
EDIYTKSFEKGLKNLTIIWDLLAMRS